MDKKHKETAKMTAGFNKISKICVIILTIVLCGAICLCTCFFTITLNRKLAELDDVSTIIITNLLELGLTILSIAVTAWAALNIVNALDRKDIQDARKTLDDLEHKTEMIEENVHRYSDVMKTASKRAFCLELLCGGRGNRFLYNLFQDKKYEENILDTSDYDDLTQIEQLFRQAKAMHKSADGADKDLINLVDRMNSLIICRKEIHYKKQNQLVPYYMYLKLREADAYFFRGYAHNSTKSADDNDTVFAIDAVSDFGRAAALYSKFLDNCNVSLIGADENAINGTLGEAYSKILQRHNSIQFKEQLSRDATKRIRADFKGTYFLTNYRDVSEIIDPFSAKDYGLIRDNAIYYCKKAADGLKDEISYRNLACAYERAAAIELPASNDSAEDAEKKTEYRTMALKTYKKALSRSVAESLPEAQVINLYKAALTYHHRLIRFCVFGDMPTDSNIQSAFYTEKSEGDCPYLTKEDLQAAVRKEDEQDLRYLDYVLDFCRLSSLAVKDMPRYKLHHTMNAFAMLWVVLLRSVYSNTKKLECLPNNKSLKADIISTIQSLNGLGVTEENDDFIRAVKNQYHIFFVLLKLDDC